MDNELSTIICRNESNWMYSGQDRQCLDRLVNAELFNSAEQRHIRVILLCEEMWNTVMPILSATGRLRGTIPTLGCKYFPVNCINQPEETATRIMQLMRLNGTTEENLNKVNAYIVFLLSLEELSSGNCSQFNMTLINKYSTISSVERTISSLFSRQRIDGYERQHLLERYAEVKDAGPLIENFLSMLNNTFYLRSSRCRNISNLALGDSICFVIKSDMTEPQISQLLQLVAWDILDAGRQGKILAISIFEGKRKYGKELTNLLGSIVSTAKVTFYSRDFFTGHSSDWQESMESYFDAWIFSSHASMSSCEAISNAFGTIPIVRSSYSCDRDRRLSNNRLIDRLFNTNRVDHYVEHVPEWEPRFRKEEVHAMPAGMCLVKADGDEYLVQL